MRTFWTLTVVAMAMLGGLTLGGCEDEADLDLPNGEEVELDVE